MSQTEALEDRILVGIERPSHLAGLRIERPERRIRGFFAGQLVVDTQHPLLVFEPRRLPVYYFPTSDVRMGLLKPTQHTLESGAQSGTLRWDLEGEGRRGGDARRGSPRPG